MKMHMKVRACVTAGLFAGLTAAVPAAHAAGDTQAIAPANAGVHGGVDGPFFPSRLATARQTPSTGDALDQQANARLATSLKSTALGQGAMTRAQAKQAGLGYVAEHFDAIDRSGSGKVSLDDVKQYLESSK
ncbi:EF-hand domain-containing protein [Paraburkholderia sp.]|uniref:EF-hand domain-containing protein n=1 Tax=Paraburkholderia sp. TaxID=1926495 RepID=UPI003D6DCD2F